MPAAQWLLRNPVEKTDKAIGLYRPDTTAPQQMQEAHELLESAAEEKEPRAQYMLAKMYERGDGVAQDFNKAFALYTQSSLNGNGDASYMLSRYLEDEQFGQKVDLQQSKGFLEKGAAQGSYTAKLLLGLALLNGNAPSSRTSTRRRACCRKSPRKPPSKAIACMPSRAWLPCMAMPPWASSTRKRS